MWKSGLKYCRSYKLIQNHCDNILKTMVLISMIRAEYFSIDPLGDKPLIIDA